MTNTDTIRRAWNATCPDGKFRDTFANAVMARINEENQDSAMQGYPPEFVEDFVAKCDAIFAEAGPTSHEAAQALADAIDTAPLYDLVGE